MIPDVVLVKRRKFYETKKLVHSFDRSLSFRCSLKFPVSVTTHGLPETMHECI